MLMSSGATPGIGVTTISSRSFSNMLMGTAVGSVMAAPPAGPMLPLGSAWLYSDSVANPHKPAPGSEEWWRMVLTATIAIRSGTVDSLGSVVT